MFIPRGLPGALGGLAPQGCRYKAARAPCCSGEVGKDQGVPGRLLGTDGQGLGRKGGTMFYDCLFSAAYQREYPPAQLLPPTPTEDREALTVAREEGVFDSRLVKLSGVTPLTSFRSWEARGHLKAGGPDAFQGCGTPGRWG